MNNKVEKMVTPPYISFEEPPYDEIKPLDSGFLWAYIKRTGNVTNMTVVQADNSSTSNTNFTNYTLNGEWHILFENDRCKLVKEGSAFNSNFALYRYNQTSNDY